MEYRRIQALQLYNAAQQGFERQIGDIQVQLDKTRAQLADAHGAEASALKTEATTLSRSVEDLIRQSATVPFPVTDTAAQLIASAPLPASPYSPDWTRNLALAIVLGLALGLSVALIRERLDDRMTGREDLEEQAGAPVLAIVPRISNWGKKGATKLVARDAPKTPPAEAYRTLRTNVGFLARTNELRLISIASPSMGEGKTTTTANLAVALAHSGKRVIAVSCDLRKPRLHRFFDLKNDSGITSILTDGLSVPQVAQRVPGLDTLRVIASGPVPHNPAELLGSEEMEQLLQDLRSYADFVLIDTAPVLVVSDALAVAQKTDGVVLVVDASTTMRGAVRATREQLELVGANIVGAVFNDFDPARAKMYHGSYRYHYYSSRQYQETDKESRVLRRTPIDPKEIWS
jgi:capsular exopolysaccharide synthesis family protein